MLTKKQWDDYVFPWLYNEIRNEHNSALFIERKLGDIKHWFIHRFDVKEKRIFVMKYDVPGKPPIHKELTHEYFTDYNHLFSSFHISKSTSNMRKDFMKRKKQ